MGKTTEEREERRKVTGRHRQPEVRRQNERVVAAREEGRRLERNAEKQGEGTRDRGME